MKLIIDIPDNQYNQICELRLHNRTFYDDAIRKGIPLPKGHGRLIDADVLCDYFWDNRSRLYPHKDLRIVIDRQPTIIEADKENEEQEEIDDWRDILDELEREEYYESKYTNGESE